MNGAARGRKGKGWGREIRFTGGLRNRGGRRRHRQQLVRAIAAVDWDVDIKEEGGGVGVVGLLPCLDAGIIFLSEALLRTLFNDAPLH